MPHQLVLVGGHCREYGLREGECLVGRGGEVSDLHSLGDLGVKEDEVEAGLELVHGIKDNLAVLIQLVVGEFHLLEGDNLYRSQFLSGFWKLKHNDA
jgi:hypothetical protein